MRRRAISVFVAAALATTAMGQVEFLDETFEYDKDHPQVGYWIGNVASPGSSETMIVGALEVKQADESYMLRMTLPGVGALNKECVVVAAQGSALTFELVAAGGTYRFVGEIDGAGQRFAGKAFPADEAEDRKERSFEFARSVRPTDLPDPLAFTGDLAAQGIKIGMTIVLAKTPGGNWVGHVDVPMQFLHAFPLINLSEQEDVIHGELPVPGGASFDVSLDEHKQHMTGRFKQSGMELEIAFMRDVNYAYKELARPQHPKPPFPYRTLEIEAPHPDGFTLAGTLTIPESAKFGDGPFPAAVMVSGSGQQDRDESLLGHKPFLVIADYLTRHGIAVMRFDDRGVGGSGGRDTLDKATSVDFATDALAVLNHLKTIESIDSARIGIIGHSEGALIAPIVATMTDDIAFIVSMAGPGVQGRDLLAVQRKLLTMATGASEEDADKANEQFAQIEQEILDGATEQEFVEFLIKLAREQSPDLKKTDEELAETVKPQAKTLMSPWFRYFMDYDPDEALRNLKCPVLALNGTLDLQVWHEQNLDAIERIMTEAGGDITIERYEGLNHLFQPATTGSVGEYAQIETTFDEQVLRDIVDWIKLKTGG
ncbi:MAG: alpha/beta fold hydrolase [Phycisphaerales bacterium]